MTTPWRLAFRHVTTHWLRSGLTVASMFVATFLICVLVSIVTTLDAAVASSASNRVIVQSAVSLFVGLPLDYQAKVAAVPGVQSITKFQYFGAYYQKPENYLAEFGVDHEIFFEMYAPEVELSASKGAELPERGASAEQRERVRSEVLADMAAERRACVIGSGLARKFGWKIGDTVPLIGTIFQKGNGSAWEFVVVGIYRPLKANMDDSTMWFRYDYLYETLQAGSAGGPEEVGVYAVNLDPGFDPAAVIAEIDGLFANGPQVTITTTEAAFQATFVSMLGNLPFFVSWIGGAVAFAVLFSVINTMLMSGRQRTHETGILKALGYGNGALVRLMLGESLLLSVTGGVAGALVAWGSSDLIRAGFGAFLATFVIDPRTLVLATALSVVVGLVGGIAPALIAARLRTTDALRSEG
ncbi:MAG: ABC transporter permease [Planctomycetota bacterium]